MYQSLEHTATVRQEILDAGAYLALGVANPEEAAALSGLSIEQFMSTLDDPDTLRQLEPHIRQMKLSGKATETRAALMLEKLLTNMESQLDGLSASMATRVGEFLLRVSGMAERRAAEMKRTAPTEGTGFSVVINLSGYVPEITRLSHRTVMDVDAVEVCDE